MQFYVLQSPHYSMYGHKWKQTCIDQDRILIVPRAALRAACHLYWHAHKARALTRRAAAWWWGEYQAMKE